MAGQAEADRPSSAKFDAGRSVTHSDDLQIHTPFFSALRDHMESHRHGDESWVRQAALAVHTLRPLLCPTGLREHDAGQLASFGHPALVAMVAGPFGTVAAVERLGLCDATQSKGFVPASAGFLVWFCDVPPVADPNAVVTIHPMWDDRPRSTALHGPELELATRALSRQYPPLAAGWTRVPVAGIGAVVFVTAATPVPAVRYVVAEMVVPFARDLLLATGHRTRLGAADEKLVRRALTALGCPSGSVLSPADARRIDPKSFPQDQRLVDAGRRAAYARL